MTDIEQTQSSLEEAFAQAAEPEPIQPDLEVEPELDLQEVEEFEPEVLPEPPGLAGDYIDVPGYGQIPMEQARRLLDVSVWANQNPDEWEQIVAAAERGSYRQQEPAREVEPEEYVDPDIAALRSELREVRTALDSRHAREVMRAVNRATSTFRESNPDVDDDLMTRMWLHIRDYNMLEPYVDRHDDEHDGTLAALQDAYRVVGFDQAVAADRRATVSTMRARRNAAAASSSQRSAPRTDPVPRTQAEKDAAMARDFAEAMQQEATR